MNDNSKLASLNTTTLNSIQLYILSLLCLVGVIFPKQSFAQAAIGGSGRLMNLAIIEMERGQYEKANDYFRQIIERDMSIPREMPYYFAKTLYHLGQYDNCNNFLNKYLSINGFRGDNYEAAIQLQTLLEEPLKAIKNCEFCDIRGYAYETCSVCEGGKHVHQNCSYCRGKGIVGCSRCAGKGMITKKNIFNITEYFECDRCAGNGRLTCPECEGQKTTLSNCNHCQGMGKLSGEQICDHDGSTKPRHLSSKFQQLIELNSHN